ncbi:hypothetical protein ACGVWS_15920, partial [Enterobacteriaceae bacterium LUAb1]
LFLTALAKKMNIIPAQDLPLRSNISAGLRKLGGEPAKDIVLTTDYKKNGVFTSLNGDAWLMAENNEVIPFISLDSSETAGRVRIGDQEKNVAYRFSTWWLKDEILSETTNEDVERWLSLPGQAGSANYAQVTSQLMTRYGAELRPVTSESAYKRLGKGTLIQWQIAGENKALILLMTDDQQTLISNINSRTGHLPRNTIRKITPRIIWQGEKSWLAAVSPQEEGFTALPLRIQAAEPGEKSFGGLVSHVDETLDPAREVAALTLTHEILPEPVPAEVGYQYAGVYYRRKPSDGAIEYFIKQGEDFYPVRLSDKYDSWMLSKGESSQEEGVYITFSEQDEWRVNRVTEDDLITPEILARRATSGARMASLNAAADQDYERLLESKQADAESGKIEILGLLRR